MICLVEQPIDIANYVEMNNLIVNLKGESNGETALTALWWASCSLAGMAKGEKLYILAHASTQKLGDYTPVQLAQKLLTAGLPEHISSIKLVACQTGIASASDPAYCVRLAEALASGTPKSVKVPVTGFTGNAVTNEFGQTRAVDDTLMAKHEVEYDALLAKFDTDINLWNGYAAKMPDGTQKELIENAKIIVRATKPIFSALYKINLKITKDKKSSKLKAVV
jgi:hypothetical protein